MTKKKKTIIIVVSVSILLIIGIVIVLLLTSNPLKGDWNMYMETKSGKVRQMENDTWTFDGTMLIQKHILTLKFYYEQTDDKIFYSENPNNIREDYYTIVKLSSKEMELASPDGETHFFLKKV